MTIPLALAAGVATLALLVTLSGGRRAGARLRESVSLLPGVALACAAVLVADALPGIPPWASLGAVGSAAAAALLLTVLASR
ncbi:hypothetical protein [Haloechinothrix halophila]|uniref:hypothetical protein n=1 Tax=Haloechinothrix halophila TaxID=1069073 RepID=UPI0003F69781|nr:hypothetical protein [Haloechinothrix halophila]